MFIDYNNINELMRGGCGHILGLFYADNPRLCPHPRLYLNLCQHNIFIFFSLFPNKITNK